jgi:hypothetical protein
MKQHNSPLDAAIDAGIEQVPFRIPKLKTGRVRAAQAAFGQIDARATTNLGNCMNWLGQDLQKENPPAYSETAQEIKMRKAAEKRARRSGMLDA